MTTKLAYFVPSISNKILLRKIVDDYMRKNKPLIMYAPATKQRQDGSWFPWVDCFGLSKNLARDKFRMLYNKPFKAEKDFQIKRFYVSTK